MKGSSQYLLLLSYMYHAVANNYPRVWYTALRYYWQFVSLQRYDIDYIRRNVCCVACSLDHWLVPFVQIILNFRHWYTKVNELFGFCDTDIYAIPSDTSI